jgi:hypothetical protein
MNTKEKIEAVLSLYKTAINSYRWENHYWNHKPFEQGFNRRLMTDTTSSLYDDVCSLFIELTLPQAHRYISMWETRYIIQGECCDPDEASYNRLQAIGQTFINECKRIAQEVCKPEGEATPRGAGYLPPDKGTAEESTDRDIKTLLQTLETLLQQYSSDNNDLNTDRAKEVFGKAIEKGLIVVFDNGLKKQGISKAQLAYMLQRIYIPDATGADGKQFPETALNGLFDESRLGEALRKLADNKNTNGKPRGYQVIDGLFNDK